jgi:SAM-dependent methyltransferase
MPNRYYTTFASWNDIAGLYQQYFMDVTLYNDTYDIFCSKIKTANASILEIGCGPGNITRYLVEKRNDFLVDATDISPNMIALAKQNNPSAHCMIMDARNIDSINKKYDGIMCGFCLPYLSKMDCEKLFNDCKQLLNTGGIFYCSAIEGNYNQSGYETGSSGHKIYVYYYEENNLKQTLTQSGFTNIQTIKKQYTKRDGQVQTHLILISSNKSEYEQQ